MVIKRYIVNNMNEAMTRIRYELGKDAVIINQRKMKKPGLLGFFSKKVIEVTAAVENSSKGNNDESNMKKSIEDLRKVMQKEFKTEDSKKDKISEKTILKENSVLRNESNDKEVPLTQINEPQKNMDYSNDVIKEMQEMKKLLNNMVKSEIHVTEKKSDLEVKLINNDINGKLIKKIINDVGNMEDDIDELERAKIVVKSMLKPSKEKMKGKIVLVGPTGVGKTTTIAKLAGRLSLFEKKKVGLITIDTYRIGAVEQLKTYADIMNIPLKVVLTIKEMDTAIDSMKDCDVILIDTTGRSSKNKMQISELRAFVDKAGTSNIHLVLSATTKDRDLESIIEGYKILNYNNIVITKLDETSTYGSILNILDMAEKPLSFVTTGQNVPDDIKIYSTEELTNFILGEDNLC